MKKWNEDRETSNKFNDTNKAAERAADRLEFISQSLKNFKVLKNLFEQRRKEKLHKMAADAEGRKWYPFN